MGDIAIDDVRVIPGNCGMLFSFFLLNIISSLAEFHGVALIKRVK